MDAPEVLSKTVSRVRSGLNRRWYLRLSVEFLLAGLSTAVVLVVPVLLNMVTSGVVCVVCLAVGMFWTYRSMRRGLYDRNEAALYLDQRFDLSERVSAAVVADQSSSRFADLVKQDAAYHLRSLAPEAMLGSVWPSRTPYLGVPLACLTFLLLLVAPELHPSSSRLHGVGIQDVQGEHEEQVTLEHLAAKLRQALARAEATGAAADRAEAARLLEELQRRLLTERGGRLVRMTGRADAPDGERPDAGEGQADGGRGIRASQIRLTALVEKARKALKESVGGDAHAAHLVEDGPDWTAFAEDRDGIPPRYVKAVRAYLRALEEAR